ncbi:MAG: YIP1 family protein [Candidatus Bathyarchaeota archaeon]|jgi:hypothetical protein|nr:YIP1 family protein [Candidatus Bathyarchaeota archaeon]
MSEGMSGFAEKLVGVLTSPRETFRTIEEGDLKKGLTIVLLAAILSAWAGMTYTSKMEFNIYVLLQTEQGRTSMPGGFSHPGTIETQEFDPEALRSRMLPFIALGGGIGALTRWLVPSLLVLVAARLLVGGGSSKRMLAMTGFAYAPMLAQQLLRVIDSSTITASKVATLSATSMLGAGLIPRIINQVLSVFTVFGIAVAILTVFAVSANFETSTKDAAKATILGYLLYVLLRTFLPIL